MQGQQQVLFLTAQSMSASLFSGWQAAFAAAGPGQHLQGRGGGRDRQQRLRAAEPAARD